MIEPVDVTLYFNFRSPYCYIASKTLFSIFDDYHARLVWRPLGGWSGRSSPERAKVKVPLTRQDVRRITAKMGIPMNPPPLSTDPTPAGAVSLLAEEKGLLRPWIVETMRAEWAQGLDIGEEQVLLEVADRVGKVWGLGSDTTKDPGPWEGEQRNMWKPTQQENLWFHGGNLHQSRHYSSYLALQLKARLAGVETPVYNLAETHHTS